MTPTKLLILLIGLATSVAQASMSPKDAVVKIWVETSSGQDGLGTGFFIDDTGRILTCYHVIQGAEEIRIVHRPDFTQEGQIYTNVIVQSYAPDRDLAILQVKPKTKPTPFISLLFDPPVWKEGEKMSIYGHPHGIFYSHLNAYPTHAGYIPSEQIKDRRLEPLFSIQDVSLLSLEAKIFDGMSGGPVLSKAGCIGVLSGSKHEQGTIGWAIPCLYIKDSKHMMWVNKAPKDIRNWPPLKLMNARRWRSLRKGARIEKNIQTALDDYFVQTNTLAALYDDIDVQAVNVSAHLRGLHILLQANPHDSLLDTPAYTHTRDGISDAWKALDQTWFKVAHGKKRLRKYIGEFESKITNLCKALPHTQKNQEIAKRYKRISRRLREKFQAVRIQFERLDKAAEGLIKVTAKPPKNHKALKKFLAKVEAYIQITLDPDFTQQCSVEVQSFRDLGFAYEEFFAEDFDTSKMSWVFHCDVGYQIVFPAGWQITGWPSEPDVADIDRRYSQTGLVPHLYLFNNMGKAKNKKDNLNINVCTITEQFEPITERHEEFFRAFLNLLYPDCRDFQIRIDAKDQKQIFVSYMTTGSGREYKGCALVIGPTKTLFFDIADFDRQYLDSMKDAMETILSSIKFEK